VDREKIWLHHYTRFGHHNGWLHHATRMEEERTGDLHTPISTIHVLAILVYAFITVEAAGVLMDWVGASGKNLTAINATHCQGDHFFGRSL
jgi:hypothetical protein